MKSIMKFQADDGQEFNTKEEAKAHELLVETKKQMNAILVDGEHLTPGQTIHRMLVDHPRKSAISSTPIFARCPTKSGHRLNCVLRLNENLLWVGLACSAAQFYFKFATNNLYRGLYD